MSERNNADALNELMTGVSGAEGLNQKLEKKLNATANAVSATKLQTARSLQVSLSSDSAQTFDGTADKKNIGVTGVLSVAHGGTGASVLSGVSVGEAAKAVQLKTARNITTNLASTTAGSFDGTANITPGVSGILSVAHGGTGSSVLSGISAAKDGAGNVITSTYATKSLATTSANGLMSSTDKTKLNALADNLLTSANKLDIENIFSSQNATTSNHAITDATYSYSFDLLVEPGFYRVAAPKDWKNYPAKSTSCYVLVMASSSSDVVVQLAFMTDNSGVYSRTKINATTWSASWNKLNT